MDLLAKWGDLTLPHLATWWICWQSEETWPFHILLPDGSVGKVRRPDPSTSCYLMDLLAKWGDLTLPHLATWWICWQSEETWPFHIWLPDGSVGKVRRPDPSTSCYLMDLLAKWVDLALPHLATWWICWQSEETWPFHIWLPDGSVGKVRRPDPSTSCYLMDLLAKWGDLTLPHLATWWICWQSEETWPFHIWLPDGSAGKVRRPDPSTSGYLMDLLAKWGDLTLPHLATWWICWQSEETWPRRT